MSTPRKKLILNTVSVNLGCGTCRRLKLRHIFHSKPKPKNQKHKLYNHSSSTEDRDDTATSSTTNTSATTFSPHYDSSQLCVRGFGRVGSEGVAVEKDSDDPYVDFRHSMLQMILENEIYSKDDLRDLLNCFLQLNSPHHHGVIVKAFTEIWNGVFSASRKSRDF
ncbi:transcription repressor OFP6-like [Abrus precatorius]|uniref:Transcription repressor n=1 Tax=Abrus precatorius TaxID=3816 RepID=A0A8B8M692_ABRPR|nr:transcription repressor OFP6-like [Abrus precatorius]